MAKTEWINHLFTENIIVAVRSTHEFALSNCSSLKMSEFKHTASLRSTPPFQIFLSQEAVKAKSFNMWLWQEFLVDF